MAFRSIEPCPFRYRRTWACVFVTAMFGPTVLFAQTATSTSLVLSASQVAAGTVVQLTATVEAGGQPVSPGQVLFYDGKTLLNSAQLLASGTASVKLRFGPGAHSLTASFAGTKTFTKSSSSAQGLTVTAMLATSTSLSASATNPYALTATVTGPGLPPLNGSVTFTDQTNNAALGTAALGAAAATQTFQPQTTYGTGHGLVVPVAVGDFNGDGIADLAVVNQIINGLQVVNTLGVLLGKGDGTFTAQQTSYSTGGNPESVTVGDFNGDGISDVATTDTDDSTVSVLLGNGDGTFQARTAYPIGSDPYSVAVGDFNGDGIPDLATANYLGNTVSVLLGKGDGTFQAQTTYGTGSRPAWVAVGDFNGDDIPDLAVSNSGASTVSVLLGKGDGTFQVQTNYATGSRPFSVAVGDFNGDGIADLATANYADNTTSVLLGKGDGTFQTPSSYGAGSGPFLTAMGDFNGDGIPDLAVANSSANTVSVLLGKGDGTFQTQTSYGTGNVPYFLAVGDFNGDGIPDLAVENSSDSTVSVLLNSVTQTANATLPNAQVAGNGTHSLQASYPGDTVYAASNGTTSVQAAPLTTTLTLSAPSAATTSEAVQLVASLSPYAYSSLTTNSETVTFTDGSTVLGTAPLSNGTAALSVMFSIAGPHAIQASYAGDINFAAASSNSATVSVTQAATFTITPTPATETIKRGVLGGFILTLKSVNGFSGSVKLGCAGGPAGSYCLNLPQTVKLSANGTGYTVSGILFPAKSAPGTYIITFTGTSGTLTVASTATFIVQ